MFCFVLFLQEAGWYFFFFFLCLGVCSFVCLKPLSSPWWDSRRELSVTLSHRFFSTASELFSSPSFLKLSSSYTSRDSTPSHISATLLTHPVPSTHLFWLFLQLLNAGGPQASVLNPHPFSSLATHLALPRLILWGLSLDVVYSKAAFPAPTFH